MLLIPAIDLKDGRCVRLKQGDMDDATVFSEDPAAMAQHWLEQGAERLHLVDLNGAVAGKPRNELSIREIVSVIGEEIPVQLGGGIRDLDTIERYLDDGITYVIIGTAAVKNPGFLHDACSAFTGHIMVGLDAREGKVATDGWSKMTGHDVIDLARKFEDYGVEAIVWGAASILPEECVELHRLLIDDIDLPPARELWARLWPLCHFLEAQSYSAAVKTACRLVGDTTGPVRAPLLELDDAATAELQGLLDRARLAEATR